MTVRMATKCQQMCGIVKVWTNHAACRVLQTISRCWTLSGFHVRPTQNAVVCTTSQMVCRFMITSLYLSPRKQTCTNIINIILFWFHRLTSSGENLLLSTTMNCHYCRLAETFPYYVVAICILQFFKSKSLVIRFDIHWPFEVQFRYYSR